MGKDPAPQEPGQNIPNETWKEIDRKRRTVGLSGEWGYTVAKFSHKVRNVLLSFPLRHGQRFPAGEC